MHRNSGREMSFSESFPDYSLIFDFERDFDQRLRRQWMAKNWHYAFYYVAAYMMLIFGGQMFMQNRTRFDLRKPLALWNLFLALFSVVGLCRILPEFLHSLWSFGFTHSVCNPSFIEQSKVSGFWTWMFTLSKVPELGDTIFIILRKRNLIFLHWYHHTTVLLFAWYTYQEHIAPARWYIFMNYLAHSIMYSYYALRAMKINVPQKIAMVITSTQILQMVVGLVVSYWSSQVKKMGEFCQMSEDTAKWAILMYLSYLILFGKYFHQAYCTPHGPRSKIE